MKLYPVSAVEVDNLRSMYGKLLVQRDDLRMATGPQVDERLELLDVRISELEDLMDEAYMPGAMVDGGTLGRIREIAAERQAIRTAIAEACGNPYAALATTV